MSCSEEFASAASGIMAHLWRLMRSVLDDSEPHLTALGFSTKAFFLLEAVQEHPFPAELARAMHVPPPTVTYLIKQLEAKGYVQRRAEPGDLRRFRLVPTAAGREALRRGRATLDGVLGERLRRLKPEEVAVFGRLAGRLARPPEAEG